MQNQYNLYNFEAQFTNYLIAENVAPSSVKHYQSDVRHFLGWISSADNTKVTLDSSHISFSEEVIESYIKYLTANNIPSKTINRRLSSLRKFGSFCISQGWMAENPAKHVKNTPLLRYQAAADFAGHAPITSATELEKEYLDYLDKEKMNPDQKKIAVQDVREFLKSL